MAQKHGYVEEGMNVPEDLGGLIDKLKRTVKECEYVKNGWGGDVFESNTSQDLKDMHSALAVPNDLLRESYDAILQLREDIFARIGALSEYDEELA